MNNSIKLCITKQGYINNTNISMYAHTYKHRDT